VCGLCWIFGQRPGGIPVGWTQPIFQEISMQINNRMENPTRIAKARAIRRDFCASSCGLLPRIMKKSAAAKLLRMAKKASATRYDMSGIIN
jgi:hypothetical protein